MEQNKIRIFLEIVIGTIITSGLLAVWIINYLSPILTAKNELALLNSEIIERRAEYQKQINEEKTHELSRTIEIVNKKLVDALALNTKSQNQLKHYKKILQKERQRYISLQTKYDKEAKKFDKSTKKRADYTALSSDIKLKISALESKISNIKKDQEEAKINEKKLQEILTFTSLNGLWKGTGTIDDKNIYLEFLPKGSIRTYVGLDGKEYVFSNQRWLIENNKIVILTKNNSKELKQIGELKDGNIIGTEEISTGNNIKWILKRTR